MDADSSTDTDSQITIRPRHPSPIAGISRQARNRGNTNINTPAPTPTPAATYISTLVTTPDPHHESYQPVGVTTVATASSVIVQIPPTAASNTRKPDTTGTIVSTLETGGRPNTTPLLTNSIPSPTSLLTTTSPVVTMLSSSEPVEPAATAARNIFGNPIATTQPSAIFEEQTGHPVPRLGIRTPGPHETNKFYANFFLGSQTAPTYVHPYSVAWSKGQGATSSWGMSVSHIDASQRVYGETQPETGAARYFLNPIGIQSLCLSAVEFGPGTTLTTGSLKSQSVNVNLHISPKAQPLITFPLVQGMGFVTAVYKGGTPLIETGIQFTTVTRSNAGPRPGITKYTMNLNDGTVWHVYGYSASGQALDLTVLNNGTAQAAAPFDGIVQVAKNPGNAETLIDAAAGAYPLGVVLSGTVSGSTGTYTFKFQKAGIRDVKLLMYALPHHYESFDSTTAKSTSTVRLQTTTKGMAKAVVANQWTMVEPNMPISMGFAPWDPVTGPKNKLSDAAIKTITPVALKELSQSVDQQSNLDSMYFSGKALAKFAALCFTANNLLKNPKLAQSGLANLKAALQRFTTNQQQFPLYYESAWGGIVSSASYQTGDSGADFGNTYYNDHHFHYGYFIYTAAVVGYLDPSWLTAENVDSINTLVRDIANPSEADKYFPVSRNFDWYHGHSWAHGLYESLDGKDQESSSEDAMAAYAIKMWGRTIKDANMEARGNLMLSVLTRSLNNYYLYTTQNKVEPSNFIGNRVAGILFENKCDHTTYFGGNIEYVQGIHMLPLLPSSKLTRPAEFVKQEWQTYFDKGRADAVEGGWKGILYGNLATVDPKTAWAFFADKNFDPSWLDGGVSLTWYQAYSAVFTPTKLIRHAIC
ncbi:glycoside hydrolase family 81 protein [Xylariaceae sp. FL0594]|nr:glycoside hydrolase family 81 protein [Xylariaceae sp. FL0594]